MSQHGRGVICVGHRGAGGHATENTIQSFRAAAAVGVEFVETDLRVTADGEIVLWHDLRVSAPGEAVTVAEASLQRLRDVSKMRAAPIVTLRELLAFLDHKKLGVVLEMKVTGIIERVYETVQRDGFSGAVVYSSFHHDEIRRLREQVPSAQTLALIDAAPVDRSRFAVDACATYAGINFEHADERFITALQSAGVKVFVYTVNDEADIKRMLALQVDGIISDYPDRVCMYR